MKKLFLNCRFLLPCGPLNVYSSQLFQIDDISPLVRIKAPLAIQANIYFGNEDEEVFPVEVDFYLLNESIVKILKAANFKPVFLDGKQYQITDEDYLEAVARAFAAQNREEAEISARKERRLKQLIMITETSR